MNILAYDTETNGLKPERHHAITLAFVLGQSLTDKLENIDRFYSLIDWRIFEPTFEIPEETIEVHGINMSDLNGQPNPLEAYSNAYLFIKEYENKYGEIDILNGFNVTFDLHMVNTDLIDVVKYAETHNMNQEQIENVRNLLLFMYAKQNKNMIVIDSMFLDIRFFRTYKHMKVRHNLTASAERMNLKNPDAHNSLVDTEVTLELLQAQINKLNEQNIPVDKSLERWIEDQYEKREARFKKAHPKSYNGREYKMIES